MRATVLLIIALLALVALAASEHQRLNDGLPLVNASLPVEHRVVIPWALNTRCTINSRNLPERQPEEII